MFRSLALIAGGAVAIAVAYNITGATSSQAAAFYVIGVLVGVLSTRAA